MVSADNHGMCCFRLSAEAASRILYQTLLQDFRMKETCFGQDKESPMICIAALLLKIYLAPSYCKRVDVVLLQPYGHLESILNSNLKTPKRVIFCLALYHVTH